MRLDYIDEAFKTLELLNEDTFNFSPKGMSDLESFLDQDDTSELVKVIDPEVTDPTELNTSYVGKVITNCNVCHSNVFTQKEDIQVNEDGIVNSEIQCPYCGELEGFTILGEIIPFNPDAGETKVEVDGEEIATAEEEVPAEKEASLDESQSLDESLDSDEDFVNESVELKEMSNRDKLKARYPELNFDNGMTETLDDSLTESMNNVNVETDDTIVTVNSDDNGKVTVSTEPKDIIGASEEIPEGENSEGDMIAPLSDETLTDIESNNSTENTDTAEVPAEEETPAEEAQAEEEEVADEDEFTEVPMEEVDEEGLDELGESYFKRVYENVNSYKTTAIYTPENKMIVEGVITFNSGKSKKTGFVFEAVGAYENGKLLFEGFNPQLSRGKKAFSLLGQMNGTKFLPESLGYDYRARNVQNVKDRVSGKITLK